MKRKITRRGALARAGATVGLLVCEAITPAIARAVVPMQACGCPRTRPAFVGHPCIVHDERGRRWDDYTAEEVAAAGGEVVQPAEAEWSCYCGRHDGDLDQFMVVGTPCIWRKTSYEYDEWECQCIDGNRDQWLINVTTDWYAMAKEGGFA